MNPKKCKHTWRESTHYNKRYYCIHCLTIAKDTGHGLEFEEAYER